MDTSTQTAIYTDQAGQAVEIPQALIGLRRRWVQAEQRHARLAGRPQSDELIDRRGELQAQMCGIVETIRAHEWWAKVDSVWRAERALWAAAGQ